VCSYESTTFDMVLGDQELCCVVVAHPQQRVANTLGGNVVPHYLSLGDCGEVARHPLQECESGPRSWRGGLIYFWRGMPGRGVVPERESRNDASFRS